MTWVALSRYGSTLHETFGFSAVLNANQMAIMARATESVRRTMRLRSGSSRTNIQRCGEARPPTMPRAQHGKIRHVGPRRQFDDDTRQGKAARVSTDM